MSSQDSAYRDSVRAFKFQQLIAHQKMFGSSLPPLLGVEIMPDPSEATIGQTRQLLRTIEELQRHQPPTPSEVWEIIRRQGVLGKVPGYDRLGAYAAIEFYSPLTSKVIEEVILRLSKQLGYRNLDEVCDFIVVDAVAALLEAATPALEVPPVICSQAELAEFLDRSRNTTGLAEKLQAEGILARFTPPSKRGGKYHFWLTDPNQHEEARKKLSCRPSKRRSKPRKM